MIIHNHQQLKSVQYNSSLKTLKTGSEVLLKIISGSGNTWKGSIKGGILTFQSALQLKPGQLLKVIVQWSGRDLILRYVPPEKQNFRSFIDRNTLPDNDLSRRILEQFKSLQIPYTDDLFARLYRKTFSLNPIKKRTLQLQLLFLEKGIDISSEDADAIQSFLFTPDPEMLNKRQQNILKMFNSVSGTAYHWIFSAFGDEKTGMSGKIGIRYSVKTKASDYIFFMFGYEDTDSNWIFSIDDTSLKPFMRIFSSINKITAFEKSEIAILFKKLNELNIGFDDTVNRTEDFELFSAAKRGKNINELA